MTFEEVYNNSNEYVFRVTAKWLKNEELAEEASQEFFFWLSRNLHNYEPKLGTFKKWFDAHLVFKIQNFKHHLSKKGRHNNREISLVEVPTSSEMNYEEVYVKIKESSPFIENSTQQEINYAGLRATIVKASKKCTPIQRKIINYFIDEGLTTEQMAPLLDKNVWTVRHHHKKAFSKIRSVLVKEYDL